jgi:hypothetical protein
MLNHAGQPTLGVPVAQGAVNQLHLIVVQPAEADPFEGREERHGAAR